MMGRLFWLTLMAVIAFAFYYVSRFYAFRLWDRDGLFGIDALRPQGGLLAGWLRGTGLQTYELIIWAVGVFLILTALQKLYDALASKGEGDDHD